MHSLAQYTQKNCTTPPFHELLCQNINVAYQLIAANLNKLQPSAQGQAPQSVVDAISAANCYLDARCSAPPTLTKEAVINTLDCYNNGHPDGFTKCTGIDTTGWPPHCP